MAARSVTITLDNQTDQPLAKTSEHLDHGQWSSRPPQNVPAHGHVRWRTESNGFLTGTEGRVVYHVGGGEVHLHWDNPYAGSNSYDQSAPDGFTVESLGGAGHDAQVTFVLRPAGPVALPSRPIGRLAVRVVTSSEALAGTDNDVYFDIGPLGWKLDTAGRNDFERGSDRTYQLPLPGVPLWTDDVVWMRLHKKGAGGFTGAPDGLDGAWKPASVHLLADGVEVFAAAVNQWLDHDHPTWVRVVRPGDREELFARALRLVPNQALSPTDESVALLTTPVFKKFLAISGWEGTPLPLTCVTGRVLRAPARSTDGLATIDLVVERVEVGGRTFALDGAHGIRGTRYLRVEYAYGGLPPLFAGNPLPASGRRVRICGTVRWDTDREGWYEIHPRSGADVVILPPDTRRGGPRIGKPALQDGRR